MKVSSHVFCTSLMHRFPLQFLIRTKIRPLAAVLKGVQDEMENEPGMSVERDRLLEVFPGAWRMGSIAHLSPSSI